MKLCYSKATFVYPYERANLESFLDGHVRAFEYFGGVPRRIAYDNLKCAVIRVGKGRKRKLNKRFKELRATQLMRISCSSWLNWKFNTERPPRSNAG